MAEYKIDDQGNLVEVPAEVIALRQSDPERYCREFCSGKNASYDRSETEGPCFHCDIFG